MGIRIDIPRTKFCKELTYIQQKELFSVKEKSFLPAIDNIYYNISIEGDYYGNPMLHDFLSLLDSAKTQAINAHRPQYFDYGLSVDLISAGMYKYCLTNSDLYDIFIASHLPNDKTPRIHVQLRAFGLWLHGAEKMLSDSYNRVVMILKKSDCCVDLCRENRIDYCYHTNAIYNPEKIFSDKKLRETLDTTLQKWHQIGRIEYEGDKCILHKDYFSIGNRKSDTVFVRFYNKALEVIEKGYKGFFFEMWLQKGLISHYDKYCFDKALLERNYNAIEKAKLEFYLEYGANEEQKQIFEKALKDKNTTHKQFKELAEYMPEVTTIMNIEYQTKRKFYSYSDKFIDGVLEVSEEHSGVPDALIRLYKILDNRKVFLNYLTDKTVSFKENDTYVSWWKRLRNTKLEGLNIDEKLLRDYSSFIDEKMAKTRFINSVATMAVYAGNLDTDIFEDISDAVSSINDNSIHDVRISMYIDAGGEAFDGIQSDLLNNYHIKKMSKHEKVKNRKRKPDCYESEKEYEKEHDKEHDKKIRSD